MRYRIEFSRNESQPGGELTRVLHAEGFVQITYSELLLGPEGTPFAKQYPGGVWIPNDAAKDEWYSDVTVTTAPSIVEEGEFVVVAKMHTRISFSPIERDSPLCEADAIGNARGTVHDSVWEALAAEGWAIEFQAARI